MKIHQLLEIGVAAALALGLPQTKALAAVETAAAASPTESMDLHVFLPLQNQSGLDQLLANQHDPNSPQYRQWLTPAEFANRFGPSASDLARLHAALVARGFTVVEKHAHGVHVRGSVSAVSRAFGTDVQKFTVDGASRFVAKSALQVPNELQGMDVRVLGLEAVRKRRPLARATAQAVDAIVANRTAVTGPYWFDDLKQAYDYPAYGAHTDGSGVTVAVLMSDLLFPNDVKAAFDHELFTTITGKPAPSVTTVLVDGGGVQNGPGSFEASLDVQQVLGGAPGTNVTLVSIPDLSDAHIADGYRYIVDTNAYDIVNSSFGGCELEYTPSYNGGVDYTYILQTLHDIFKQGNAQGITFVASSGDQGGLGCPSPDYGNVGATPVFVPGVSSPADDPNVTAVGGGNLITTTVAGQLDSAYVRESAYGDPQAPYDIYGIGQNVSGGYWGAGGGVSSVFSKPAYQALVLGESDDSRTKRWRTLPDVGMQVGGLGFSASPVCEALVCNADDSSVRTAFGVGLGGGFYRTIGTSVSSPEFVGALSLFEQQFGRHHRLGNVNYYLYALAALQNRNGGASAPSALQFYHRNIPGFDGYWSGNQPNQNYDYIYGNGSPDVRKLFGMTAYPAAGTPQTPGNP